MSAETKANLEAAIAAHLADEMDGPILTGWWCVMSGAMMDRPEATAYHYTGPDTQPYHATVGLDRMSTFYVDSLYNDE